MPEKPGPDRSASDREVLAVIRDAFAPAVGTAEVAEELDVDRKTADRYLRELADDGFVHQRMVGQVAVWWLSDAGRRKLAEDPSNGG